MPDGVVTVANFAALFPLADTAPGLFDDAVTGCAIVKVRYNGCAAASEGQHARDDGMPRFVDGCVLGVVRDLKGHGHCLRHLLPMTETVTHFVCLPLSHTRLGTELYFSQFPAQVLVTSTTTLTG